MTTSTEMKKRIREIRRKSFATVPRDAQRQEKTLARIIPIIQDTKKEELLLHPPDDIILCLVRVLFLYAERPSNFVDRISKCRRRKKIRSAQGCFHDLLHTCIPQKTEEVINAVLNAICTDKLWKFETFCFELIWTLLQNGVNAATIAHVIWNRIESPKANTEDARGTIKIFYELLNIYYWPDNYETFTVIQRVLNLFYNAIISSKMQNGSGSHAAFKNGLEVCIRNMIKHISNDHLLIVIQQMCGWAVKDGTTDDIILEFGCVLEFTAYIHKVSLYEKTLTTKVFPLLMRMIASDSKIISLLGNRVMHYLLDRHENKVIFDTPKIFFENAHTNLKIGQCYKEDKLFCKDHREILHDSLLKSMIKHSDCRMNLEASYCTICLMATEVPCGFTAAAIVCFIMNLQDVTLKKKYKNYPEAACHIHATVIAIMSLLCWIHKAKVFYSCVNKIMMERAQWAPHLNPPIRSQYNFAVHHVLWDKPGLFFVDWEVRYGLWKCFRLQQEQQNSQE